MKPIFAIILVACLAACSSAPATQYYQLPDSAFLLPKKNTQTVGVKIILAQAIKNENLLYQTDAYTLHFAQNNLWASPLEAMINASLSNKLNRSSSLKYAPNSVSDSQTQLTVYFDRFQGSYTGDTEISGYAQWQSGAQIPFHIHTPQNGNGYAAMLQSLDNGLTQIAQKIAQSIQ